MKALYTLLIGLLIVGCNNAGQQGEQKEQKREKQGGGFFAPVEDKLLGTFSLDPSGKMDFYSIVKEGDKYMALEKGKKDVEFIPVKVEDFNEKEKKYLIEQFNEANLEAIIDVIIKQKNVSNYLVKTKEKIKISGKQTDTEYFYFYKIDRFGGNLLYKVKG
ncbi:hypothetical protein [Capnocytophaga canis]|uniref:hypothetical protein n=1 Tax=Capnocytophaga canis TaxID=1848903 RepID=UPI001562CEA4|nr:hypothetical protein [Capnocytophaga canis]